TEAEAQTSQNRVAHSGATPRGRREGYILIRDRAPAWRPPEAVQGCLRCSRYPRTEADSITNNGLFCYQRNTTVGSVCSLPTASTADRNALLPGDAVDQERPPGREGEVGAEAAAAAGHVGALAAQAAGGGAALGLLGGLFDEGLFGLELAVAGAAEPGAQVVDDGGGGVGAALAAGGFGHAPTARGVVEQGREGVGEAAGAQGFLADALGRAGCGEGLGVLALVV